MYSSSESEIILKMHKLCTIYESAHEQSERIQSELSSSFIFENDDELKAVQVLNLLKLTGFTLRTIKHDIQYIQNHLDNVELNIQRITKNGAKIREYAQKK
ncbi:Hypothetical_protein [Hexamita inflata]|uniref:Hypothetical_protein n=1 Tax=Hexamita inflata TaxID=28002 RepID=A0AA86N9L9_9EUKA|nr:Hypothetical protein HINF_LOCUS2858 [Hexamita inflata]